jgi:hypothetical protein
MQHFSRLNCALTLTFAVAATSLAPAAPASAQESLKLGIVSEQLKTSGGHTSGSMSVAARTERITFR